MKCPPFDMADIDWLVVAGSIVGIVAVAFAIPIGIVNLIGKKDERIAGQSLDKVWEDYRFSGMDRIDFNTVKIIGDENPLSNIFHLTEDDLPIGMIRTGLAFDATFNCSYLKGTAAMLSKTDITEFGERHIWDMTCSGRHLATFTTSPGSQDVRFTVGEDTYKMSHSDCAVIRNNDLIAVHFRPPGATYLFYVALNKTLTDDVKAIIVYLSVFGPRV